MKNKKELGQHWLYNRIILDKIADYAANRGQGGAVDFSDRGQGSAVQDSAKKGFCLEIGPGLGTLTASLLKRFEKVLAVEFDADLARKLPGSFPGTNLEVVQADFLQFDLNLVPSPYAVAGNIPYYITSPIIEKLIMAENRPERVVLLMQKEVCERIVSEKESVLSLTVKNRARVLAGPVVLREEFTPPPKVDSQILILEPKAPEVSEAVIKFIRVAFAAPRKKLAHNLAVLKPKEKVLGSMKELGISPDARPADLHLEDYRRLFESML